MGTTTYLTPNDLPIRIVSPQLSYAEIDAAPLSFAALQFLATITAVFNNEAAVPRTHHLGPLRRLAQARDVDVEGLITAGYLHRHRVGSRGNTETFTPTKQGRDVCGMALNHGPGIGDVGDGMPHRYGADLTRAALEAQKEVSWITSFRSVHPDTDGRIDLAGLQSQPDGFEITRVYEIEGGMSVAERADRTDSGRAGSNNYESYRRDYDLMAEIGDSGRAAAGYRAGWVVRDRDVAERVLRALGATDRLSLAVDELLWRFRKTDQDTFNEEILADHGGPGMDRLYTFAGLETA